MTKSEDRARAKRALEIVHKVRSTFETFGLLRLNIHPTIAGQALTEAAQLIENNLSIVGEK